MPEKFNIGDYKSWYYNHPEFGLERHTPNLQGIAVTNQVEGLHPRTSFSTQLQTTQPQVTTGQRLKNAASGLIGTIGGIMGGPLGWASLAVSAIGDNIRAAKSQFDLQGFQNQLNDAGGDYLRAAGSANTTSDLINLAGMRTDFLEDINNQGYQWDGNILGGIGAIFGNAKTERDKEQARQLQARMSEIESYGMQNALNRVNNNTYRFGLANYLNNAAMGGPLFTHGSDFTDDLIRVDAGGSHESNPLGGVPAGIDPQGIPNLVEEGETIWDNGEEEYVFSKRLKAPKKLVNEFKLGGGKKGLTYSDAARRISDKSGAVLRPNDAISQRTKDAMLAELEESQEEKRAQIQKRQLLKELESMSPEELQGLAGMMQQPQMPPQGMEMQPPVQEPVMQEPVQGTGGYEPVGFALGGHILDGLGETSKITTPYKIDVPSVAPVRRVFRTVGQDGKRTYSPWNYGTSALNSAFLNFLNYDDYADITSPGIYFTDRSYLRSPLYAPEETVGLFSYPMGASGVGGGGVRVGASGRSPEPVERKEFGPKLEKGEIPGPTKVESSKEQPATEPLVVKTEGKTPELKPLATWMRYAPIVGSGLSVIGNLFNNPDYSEYQGLINAAKRLGKPVTIPVETIGERIRRNPFDERLAVNQANQNLLSGLRTTLDTAGGNRAFRQYATNVLAHNNQGALSDIASKAYLANRQDALQTMDFNRGTSMYNASAINQRNLTQAQLNSSRQQAGLSGLLGAQNALDNARRWDEQFVDADLTGFLQGLGDLGRENEQRNWLASLAREGVLDYVFGPNGQISFLPRTSTTAKCGGKIKTKKRRF